jgi:hypothetical protein
MCLVISACSCPFGVCHQVTGQCICPPLVEGDRCDRCKPEAYGYDVLIGCQVRFFVLLLETVLDETRLWSDLTSIYWCCSDGGDSNNLC